MSVAVIVIVCVPVLLGLVLVAVIEDQQPLEPILPADDIIHPKEEPYEVPQDRLLYEAQCRKEQFITEALREMGYERQALDLRDTELNLIDKENDLQHRERGVALDRKEVINLVAVKDAEYQQREQALQLGAKELDLIKLAERVREREERTVLQEVKNQIGADINTLQARHNELELKSGRIGLGMEELRLRATENSQRSLSEQLSLERKENSLQQMTHQIEAGKERLGLDAYRNRLDSQSGQQHLESKQIGLGMEKLRLMATENSQHNLSERLVLDKRSNELQQIANRIETREDRLALDGYKNQLDGQDSLQKLAQKEIGLGIEKLRLMATENTQRSLSERLALEKQGNTLQRVANQIEAGKERLTLDAYRNRLDSQADLQQLAFKEIDLGMKALKQQAWDNSLSAREVTLRQQFKENQLALRKQWIDLQSDKLTFQEKQAAFRLNIKYQTDVLSIRKLKLDLLQSSVNEDYRIKSAWLKIQSGANRNEYQRQQLNLDRTKQQIDKGLESLRLSAWSNQLQLKEGDVRQQRVALELMHRYLLR